MQGKDIDRKNAYKEKIKIGETQEEAIKDCIFADENLEEEQKGLKDYLYANAEEEIMKENLVNGALLKCQKATGKVWQIDDCYFHAKANGTSHLRVFGDSVVRGQAKANTADCRMGINILPFGNCMSELSAEEKAWLKRQPEARQEGTCKYLMHLAERWDMLPREGDEYFRNGEFPELNMQSALFCLRGAWIYPISSGQSESYVNELIEMTADEMQFAYENGFTREQMAIFKDIRQYYEDVPKLEQENVIFAFEGLGNYSGTTNSDHPKGQFGAIFIYCKRGELITTTDNCSTLPDHIEKATIEDGIYRAVYKMHNSTYQALQLWTSDIDQTISACYHDENEEANYRRASGINMHAAGNLAEKAQHPWSAGCLTISVEDYYLFGTSAGFIGERNDGNLYNTYSNIKLLNNKIEEDGVKWGYVVVNREYMEDGERERFLENYEERKK